MMPWEERILCASVCVCYRLCERILYIGSEVTDSAWGSLVVINTLFAFPFRFTWEKRRLYDLRVARKLIFFSLRTSRAVIADRTERKFFQGSLGAGWLIVSLHWAHLFNLSFCSRRKTCYQIVAMLFIIVDAESSACDVHRSIKFYHSFVPFFQPSLALLRFCWKFNATCKHERKF